MRAQRSWVWAGTALALCAFAGNSILCRLALASEAIDPASFTSLRLASGALVLALVTAFRGPRSRGVPRPRSDADWTAALALAVYASAFSFAYVSLGASTGALILFGAVQATMLGVGMRAGERFTRLAWLGFAGAALGLVILVLPGLRAPPPLPAALMGLAGVAWGLYSLRGRGARDPVRATADNFARAFPVAVLVSALTYAEAHVAPRGAVLALLSGALTSGLGYVIWYWVLGSLEATRAATVQLSVPALAAVGGVVLLSEPVNARLVLASMSILGGIALVLAQRARPAANS